MQISLKKAEKSSLKVKAPKVGVDIDLNDEAHSKMDDVIFRNKHTEINSDEKLSNSWKHRAKRIKQRLIGTNQ